MKTTSLPLGVALALCAFGQSVSRDLTADRFKADLLVIVAHPDDETVIGSYLARAIFDEHKRVAVVFGTRGDSGGDEVGQQQAASLGAIREIEGRRAMGYLGVTNVWFLDGPDTPGQDVLRSLETWDHGRSLGRLVRLVRLTRPTVIATWLPDYVAGENHGDHQAAGVLATEAFDLAGNPTEFPEQVTAARDVHGISNLTEGLRPWQPQKLYYFSDASHTDFLKGQGPEYAASDVSPSKKETYAKIAAEEAAFHLTQGDSGYMAAVALQKNEVERTYLQEPAQLVFGKSYVSREQNADVFAGISPRPIAYRAPPQFDPSDSGVSFALGGPWHFYRQFWKAHGLDHLATLVPPEVLAGVSTQVTIPFLVSNPGKSKLSGTISADPPPGWRLLSGSGSFEVSANDVFAGSVIVVAPAQVNASWQAINLSANAAGQPLGQLTVRVQVASSSLPQ
jgi:LmbE family N-acetylglucosaminyl deacetylase